jgi:hypothetical protein
VKRSGVGTHLASLAGKNLISARPTTAMHQPDTVFSVEKFAMY